MVVFLRIKSQRHYSQLYYSRLQRPWLMWRVFTTYSSLSLYFLPRFAMSEDETTPLSRADSSSRKSSLLKALPRNGIHKGHISDTDVSDSITLPQQLRWYRKLAFGVGHVFNDLAASMWFTYLILFYHKVVLLDNILAGTLLLIGQAVDGTATPIIGFLCDSTPFWFMGFGRRKIWHLIGTLLVSISLFFFWHTCLPCKAIHAPMPWEIVWYAVFIAIFQVGWACVQISHLALIPELTKDKHVRVELNSIRLVCACAHVYVCFKI